jgi:hypothetical protein
VEVTFMRFVQRRVALLACVPVAVALSGCNRPANETPAGASAPASAAAPAMSPVERGKLLIIGGGCHDCHTPKVMTPRGPEADMTKLLSGHPESAGVPQPFKGEGQPWSTHTNDHLTAWSGAWGVSFAANLTPDQNTGLGIWTEEMFLNALKQGKHMGTARPILPPMPWNWYGQLPDDDLKAMFAYLKSIPAIANRVPVPLDPSGKPIEEPQ